MPALIKRHHVVTTISGIDLRLGVGVGVGMHVHVCVRVGAVMAVRVHVGASVELGLTLQQVFETANFVHVCVCVCIECMFDSVYQLAGSKREAGKGVMSEGQMSLSAYTLHHAN